MVRSEPLGTRGLRMSWRLAGGRALDLLANLGPDPVAAPTPAGEPLYVTPPGLERCDAALVGRLELEPA